MNEPLTNDTVITLAVIALVAICVIAWNLRWAFERPVERDADRIETAIRDATRDLLGVLEEIRDSNAYLEESERDYNQREGHADEAPGTSIHRLMEQYGRQREAWMQPRKAGRPDGLWFVDDIEPAVDLRKHD
jgi:hypothetical protein